MDIFYLASRKGGSGKTTLTINLSAEAARNGKKTLIVDIDPQASSVGFGNSRKNLEDSNPIIVQAQSNQLKSVLDTAERHNTDIVFIDTAPHSESASLEVARSANLIIIPCRPTILDLRAIGNTINLAKQAGTTAIVVLNAVPHRGGLVEEAKEAIKQYGVEVAPVTIGHRSSFFHSLTVGMTTQEFEPRGKGTDEITRLYKWIFNRIKK